MTIGKIEGTFTEAGASEPLSLLVWDQAANLSVDFASTGSVSLQRSLDGVNWRDACVFTESAEKMIRKHTEAGVRVRLNCTDAGTGITYRISY